MDTSKSIKKYKFSYNRPSNSPELSSPGFIEGLENPNLSIKNIPSRGVFYTHAINPSQAKAIFIKKYNLDPELFNYGRINRIALDSTVEANKIKREKAPQKYIDPPDNSFELYDEENVNPYYSYYYREEDTD